MPEAVDLSSRQLEQPSLRIGQGVLRILALQVNELGAVCIAGNASRHCAQRPGRQGSPLPVFAPIEGGLITFGFRGRAIQESL
jgi:hypothetical protein